MTNSWIKSEDRLPDSDVDVLVYFGLGEYIVCRTKLISRIRIGFASEGKHSDAYWMYPLSSCTYDGIKIINGTYWTHLPQPPEVEE